MTGIGRWSSGSHDDFKTTCPECGDRLVRDPERGEQACHNCGYVDSASPDAGPEWKAMDLEEKNRRVRVGSPTTLAMHDHGLTTEIGSTMRDAHGKSLDASIRPTVQRMRRWQTWARTFSSEERSLSVVLSKIRELCRTLGLPDIVAETAAQVYRTTAKTKVAKGRSITGMASATVYLACRKCGVSRTCKEVARAAGLEKGDVARYFKLVVKEVEKENVPPTSVEKHVSKLVNLARIDPKIERLALNLSRSTSGSISSGKVPAGLAAAYVYMSSLCPTQPQLKNSNHDVARKWCLARLALSLDFKWVSAFLTAASDYAEIPYVREEASAGWAAEAQVEGSDRLRELLNLLN